MLPELSRLIDVQEIDKEIREVTQEMARLPEELQAGEAAVAELQAQQAAGVAELENLKSQRRQIEMEMAEMEEGITTSRQRLMEIKSNIEYKAMLKEIAFKEDQRDQRETRTLELMDQMEAQQQLIDQLTGRIEEQQAVVAGQAQEVEARLGELRQELAKFEGQRKKLRTGVPAALLKRYEFIRQRRNGSAITPVREGVCMGCHMNILPQQFIDLQKGAEILQCPHCQRILYWLGDEAEEESSQQAS